MRSKKSLLTRARAYLSGSALATRLAHRGGTGLELVGHGEVVVHQTLQALPVFVLELSMTRATKCVVRRVLRADFALRAEHAGNKSKAQATRKTALSVNCQAVIRRSRIVRPTEFVTCR